jgi:hypothetical protein
MNPMKTTLLLTAMRHGARRIPTGLVIAAALLLQHNAMAVEVDLGTANNFAVLAGSTITSASTTTINGGDVGLSPGTSITGPISISPPYTTHVADGVALQAQTDLTTAYNEAAGFAPTATLTDQDLGGMTLTPGVYFFSSSAQLTGMLTLDGAGLTDPVFVFQIGSTLTTASGSSVVTINDGGSSTPGISVFWQIGSSATLGTDSAFEGNILALTSITLNTGATVLDGRLLARNGAVTLDGNDIMAPPAEVIGGGSGGSGGENVPDAGSTLLLLGLGVFSLLAVGPVFKARHQKRAFGFHLIGLDLMARR